jgi:hypothetical protein
MSRNRDSLKLGKGKSFFVKSQLRRLLQEDETWEADFRALPKPILQTKTHYLGLVLTRPHGFLLADHEVERTPTVNDLARLLAEAMRRPGTEEGPHRPRCIYLRGNPRWTELLPHLKELGIKVLVRDKLPKVNKAFEEFLQQEKETRSATKVKPTTVQAAVEKQFPAIAKWVHGYGHIEIGDQESFGFVVRALSYGNLVFEDDKPNTLAEAMAALEKGLSEKFKEEGVK